MYFIAEEQCQPKSIVNNAAFIAVIFSIFCCGALAQQPGDWGVIKSGTFVIPSEDLPWTDPDGRAAGKRIGYLQVGTVVKIGECKHVNGPDEDSTGQYCHIRSEVGTEGKAQAKRIFVLQRGRTYAFARRGEVMLYRRDNLNVRGGSFSRNAGVVVELVGDWRNVKEQQGVDVIATYNLYKPNTLIELAAIKSDLINKTDIIEMPADVGSPPEKFERTRTESGLVSLEGGPVALWSFKRVTAERAEQLAEKVYHDMEWTNELLLDSERVVSKIFKITSTVLDSVLCASRITADVSLGWKFLGNGLKIQGKIPVHNEDKLFNFDVDIVERNGKVKYWLLTSKTVSCHVGSGVADSYPRAVEEARIFLVKGELPQGTPAIIVNRESHWYGLETPEAVDATDEPRLFYIREFLDYAKARRFIATSMANSGLIDQLDRQERKVFQHSVLANLGYFQREALIDDLD